MSLWIAVAVAAAGCYALKLAGLSVPERVLADPRVTRVAEMLPIALLTALIVIQTFTGAHGPTLDARAGGLVAAVAAAWARAPFLVVVLAGVLVTALLRRAGM